MAKRLYVGNLSYRTTQEELLELFKQAGHVVGCDLIIDRNTDRSKGFAFVEMESDQDAGEAISQFDGKEWGGRTLKVNEARPRPERSHSFSRTTAEAAGRDSGRRDDGNHRRH
jgi:RNA recognition motif-containing protein